MSLLSSETISVDIAGIFHNFFCRGGNTFLSSQYI